MAKILQNHKITSDIYQMTVSGAKPGNAGQFYMVRHPNILDPLFGRPISLYDCDRENGTISFLYKTVGKATKIFSGMLPGDTLEVNGPYGNGFPLIEGDAFLIGGGIGIAPLYLLAKTLHEKNPDRKITAYLGYKSYMYKSDEFKPYANSIVCAISGSIIDKVNFRDLSCTYFACGPEAMLDVAAEKAHATGALLYISKEAHMSCGVGACLGCTCKTRHGNKRICKDGPVFRADEFILD